MVYAIDRKTRQVADIKVGRRTNKTLGHVVNTLILAESEKIYTDGLNNYNSLIPEKMHKVRAFGTNHIERMNLNLRNCLKRLQRKTICFSKSEIMLEACLKLYFWYVPDVQES